MRQNAFKSKDTRPARETPPPCRASGVHSLCILQGWGGRLGCIFQADLCSAEPESEADVGEHEEWGTNR